MSVVLCAFLAMVCWGIGDFFIQRSVRKVGNVEALFYIGLVSSVFLLPFVLSDVRMLLQGDWIFLVAIGIFTFLISLVNFEALKRGKLSVVEVILEIELPFVILLGLFVFQESLSLLSLGLMALVFVGVSLVAMRNTSHFSGKLEKGIWLALMTALGLGLLDFFTASAARSYSPLLAIWLPWFAFTIACFILMVRRGSVSSIGTHLVRYKWVLLPMAFLDVAAWVFYAYALEKGSLAIVTAITESYPAIALLLGVWYNRERIKNHQWFGAGLALLASVCLALVAF